MAPKKARAARPKTKSDLLAQAKPTAETSTSLALTTAALETAYAHAQHSVAAAITTETIRQLRTQLETANHARSMMADKKAGLKTQLQELNSYTDQVERMAEALREDGWRRAGELEGLKAQLESLQSESSTASQSVLAEKLALSRKLSDLKPMVDHLRAQVADKESILSDKLALQSEVKKLQLHLANEKRAADEMIAKTGRTAEVADKRAAELERQLATERQLQDEKDGHIRALERERDDKDNRVRTLEKEQSERDSRIQALERELAAERDRAGNRNDDMAQQVAALTSQVAGLTRDVDRERKLREKAQTAVDRVRQDWEAEKSIFTDKLNAYKTKVRTTKEQLKEANDKVAAAAATVAATSAAARRRPAATDVGDVVGLKARRGKPTVGIVEPVDLDATIGTPGDGPSKRQGRKILTAATAALGGLGERSMFSMTPFLERSRIVGSTGGAGTSEPSAVFGTSAVSTSGLSLGLAMDRLSDEDEDDSFVGAIMAADASRIGGSILNTDDRLTEIEPSVVAPAPAPIPGRGKLKNGLAPSLTSAAAGFAAVPVDGDDNDAGDDDGADNASDKEPEAETVVKPKAKAKPKPKQKAQKRTSFAAFNSTFDDIDTGPAAKDAKGRNGGGGTASKSTAAAKAKTNGKAAGGKAGMTTTTTTTKKVASSTGLDVGLDPQPAKKKRRLPNNSFAAKTLFDEDDDPVPTKLIPGKGRSMFGRAGAAGKKMLLQDQGFEFSPLKRGR